MFVLLKCWLDNGTIPEPDSCMKWPLIFAPLIFGVLFYAAIPPTIYPYSIADIFLVGLSVFSVFFVRKLGMAYVYLAILWFNFSSILGNLQGFDTSFITATSLGLKWAGALTLYFFLTSKLHPNFFIIKSITVAHIFVLVSLLTNSKLFPDTYYSGNNGIFQSSADGGFYLLCYLGFLLNAYKIIPTKLIALNIVISSLSLFLVDSRFAAALGGVVLFYYIITNKSLRFLIFFIVLFISISVYFDVLSIPHKLYFFNNFDSPLTSTASDMSMLIRVNNFISAFDMTSSLGYLVGNGAGFFKMNVINLFFDQNYSLDNSYIYLLLSFGAPGLILFLLIFMSRQGFSMGRRGALTFLPLSFSLVQDCFSNSFCILALAIFLSVDTMISKETSQSLSLREDLCKSVM